MNKSAHTGCPFRPRRQQFSTSGHICEQGRVPISIGLNSCVNKTLFWARDERHAPMVATAELFVELGLLKAEDDCRRKRLTRLIDLKNVYSWLKTEVTKVFTFYILTWNYRHPLWFGKKTSIFKKTCLADWFSSMISFQPYFPQITKKYLLTFLNQKNVKRIAASDCEDRTILLSGLYKF